MATREKIREGIRTIAKEWFAPGGLASQTMPNERSFEGDVVNYLHSQDVVIKDIRHGMGMDTRGGYTWRDVFFVIPLIKEEPNGNNEVP